MSEPQEVLTPPDAVPVESLDQTPGAVAAEGVSVGTGASGSVVPVPTDDHLAALAARVAALETAQTPAQEAPRVVPSDSVYRGVVDLEPLPVDGVDKNSERWLAVHAPGNAEEMPWPGGAA